MQRVGQWFSAIKVQIKQMTSQHAIKRMWTNLPTNQPTCQPTTLLTYLNGSNAAAVTAMSARVIHSPTKYVLGSRALSRTFRTRIKSARELCWAWGNTRGHMRSHTSKDKIFRQCPLDIRLTFLSTAVTPINGKTTAQDTGVSSLSAKLSHCQTWLCCFTSTPAFFPCRARYQDTALAPLRTESPSPLALSNSAGLKREFRDAGGSSVRILGRDEEQNSAAIRAKRLLKSSGWGDT